MSAHSEHSGHHGNSRYVIIWALLVVLFVASLGFAAVTSFIVGVVFAFFIAIIKALMVAAWFMHLNIEERWIWVILLVGLLIVLIMWMGVAPDVMEPSGTNWQKIPLQ